MLYLFLFLLIRKVLQCKCQDLEISGLDKTSTSKTLTTTSLSPLINKTQGYNLKQDENIEKVMKRSQVSTVSVLENGENVTVTDKSVSDVLEPSIPGEPISKLPLSIIITAPSVAAGITLFLCIAFYFHNLQLNKKAQRISLTLIVAQQTPSKQNIKEHRSASSLPPVSSFRTSSLQYDRPSRNNSIQTMNGFLPRNNSAVTFHSLRDPAFLYQQNTASTLPRITSKGMSTLQNVNLPRNNSYQNVNWTLPRNCSAANFRNARDMELIPQHRRSIISLGLPSRGSTLSAYADQEIAYQSAKRKHSIFIL